MKPHKHAEIIKAWADGAQIQCKDEQSDWCDVLHNGPSWNPHYQYRIKTEPKPDVVRYGRILQQFLSQHQGPMDDIKVIFDGETGKPKAAEVLK